MKKLILVTILVSFFSCTDKDDEVLNVNQSQIRVSNNSQYNYENVTIHTSSGDIVYNDIASNQSSGYRTFNIIASDNYVEFTINGNNFSSTFYYDNSTNITDGSYTLEITANGTPTVVQSVNSQLLTD